MDELTTPVCTEKLKKEKKKKKIYLISYQIMEEMLNSVHTLLCHATSGINSQQAGLVLLTTEVLTEIDKLRNDLNFKSCLATIFMHV
jgi:predicted oxidoreductase (fatty acid repression mutant protein)